MSAIGARFIEGAELFYVIDHFVIQPLMYGVMLSPLWLLIAGLWAIMTKRRGVRALLIVMCCLFAVASAGEAWFMYEFHKAVAEVTNPARYQESLNRIRPQLQRPGALDVFPATIPADATDVRFSYSPAFLQGGNVLKLRYKLPPRALHLAVVHANLKKVPTTRPTDEPDFPPSFYEDGSKVGDDPMKDFQIIPIDFVNQVQFDDGTGYAAGIAVSEKRGEIIYWYQDK